MNKLYKTIPIIGLSIMLSGVTNSAVAQNDIKTGENYLYQASTAMVKEEKDHYVNEACKAFQKAYNTNPKSEKAIVGLGKTLAYRGIQTTAKNILLSGYSLYPDSPSIQAAIADYYYFYQEYNNALEFYKLALSCGYLKDYKTNYSIATCYEKLGDLKNAKLYYEITLMINPRYKLATDRLNNLETMNQYKPTKAKSIFENTQTQDSNTDYDTDINKLIDNCSKLR